MIETQPETRLWPPPEEQDEARETENEQEHVPSFSEQCQVLADEGDVLGLLAQIRSKNALTLPPDVMDYLSTAIRQKQSDVVGLTEAAFAEIMGFATLMLIRCELRVERRLAESARYGGDPTHLPEDLNSEGWLERIERISRFVTEIASARSRIQHLEELSDDKRRKDKHARRPNNGMPLGTGSGPFTFGEARPLNGRLRRPETRIHFP